VGGRGSGRYDRRDKRDTTASANRIDIRRWHRGGHLQAGGNLSARWCRGEVETGSVGGYVESLRRIVLEYRTRSRTSGDWSDVVKPIDLDWTSCTFGGARPWFRCPTCGRRVAILYLTGSHCACRQCCRLAYASTREAPRDRLLYKAQAIRERLGGTANVFVPFPTRPKGMRHRTYERLRRDCELYEHASLMEAMTRLDSNFSAIVNDDR